MYVYHNSMLPLSFCQTFQSGNQLHRYSTRYSDQTHFCRTSTKKFSLLFQDPKMCNSLPNRIKATTSAPSFKRLMKSFLRGKMSLNHSFLIIFSFYFFLPYISSSTSPIYAIIIINFNLSGPKKSLNLLN